jgi:hypothetical protein
MLILTKSKCTILNQKIYLVAKKKLSGKKLEREIEKLLEFKFFWKNGKVEIKNLPFNETPRLIQNLNWAFSAHNLPLLDF